MKFYITSCATFRRISSAPRLRVFSAEEVRQCDVTLVYFCTRIVVSLPVLLQFCDCKLGIAMSSGPRLEGDPPVTKRLKQASLLDCFKFKPGNCFKLRYC